MGPSNFTTPLTLSGWLPEAAERGRANLALRSEVAGVDSSGPSKATGGECIGRGCGRRHTAGQALDWGLAVWRLAVSSKGKQLWTSLVYTLGKVCPIFMHTYICIHTHMHMRMHMPLWATRKMNEDDEDADDEEGRTSPAHSRLQSSIKCVEWTVDEKYRFQLSKKKQDEIGK